MHFTGVDDKIDTQEINDILKIALMLGDVRLYEETEGVAGDVYILDGKILAPSHLGKLSPSVIKKFFVCVQVNICNNIAITNYIYLTRG